MLKKTGESRHTYLRLTDKHSVCYTEYNVSYCCFVDTFFYHVEVSISTLLGGFSMSGCEIFSKDIYASINMIMCFFL